MKFIKPIYAACAPGSNPSAKINNSKASNPNLRKTQNAQLRTMREMGAEQLRNARAQGAAQSRSR